MNKRFTVSLLSAGAFMTMFMSVSASAAAVGDVDGSGKVNARDAVIVLQSVANKVTLTDEQKQAADVDASGAVTARDAVMILKYTAGSITSFGSDGDKPDTSKNPVSEEEKYANAPAPVLASRTMPEDYSTKPVEFKAEIDEFYKQVKELPIPDEHKGDYDYYTSNGLSVRKLEIDGIPLYEGKKDDGELKPLVIQLHGGGWHKDFDFATCVAHDENVCAVAIDCSGCGESQDGPIQAPAAWMETVKDIDTLIEYYNTIPDVDATNFGLIGYSMGGNISEYYTIYGKYKPTAICLENAGSDLTDTGAAWDCFNKGRSGLKAIWTEEQLQNFTTATAPLSYPEYFKDIWVYMCVGELDDTHSPAKMEEFKNAIEALGSRKVVYHLFKGVGHETPQSWRENEQKDFFAKLRYQNESR